MAGLADFHPDAPGQLGGDPEPRAEDFQNERIARADELHAAAQADAERLEALRVLVVGRHAAHHGANVRRQFVEPHQRGGMVNRCHREDKISFPAGKSITSHTGFDPKIGVGGDGALRAVPTTEPSGCHASPTAG